MVLFSFHRLSHLRQHLVEIKFGGFSVNTDFKTNVFVFSITELNNDCFVLLNLIILFTLLLSREWSCNSPILCNRNFDFFHILWFSTWVSSSTLFLLRLLS